MARRINKILTPASIAIWSLIDRQTRLDLIKDKNTPDTAAILYKRLEDGRGLSADFVNGLAIWAASLFVISPLPIGWAYYTLDAIQEVEYINKVKREIKELRGMEPQTDPCLPPEQEAPKPIDTTCSLEKKQSLRKEIDSYEPEESN
jgi:hypothetical protein